MGIETGIALRPCTYAYAHHVTAMKKVHTYFDYFDGPKFDGSRGQSLARLERLSRLLDTAFVLPGTDVRFGIEAVMRLIPGIGDAAASALSCWLLYEAHQLKIPSHIFARMVLNVAIEGIVGAVPFLGDLFDVGFRANRRNVKILRDYFERI